MEAYFIIYYGYWLRFVWIHREFICLQFLRVNMRATTRRGCVARVGKQKMELCSEGADLLFVPAKGGAD